MPQSVVEKAGEHIAESVREISRIASAASGAFEDGVRVAKRAAKQGGDAAEDFVNDTTRCIQRHPMVTVAVTLVAGFTVGMLTGLIMRQK
jgi:ElaB/YqjD/DUF883 family membrane-anchored ribosome-binding protein